jgi:hypothetical protein
MYDTKFICTYNEDDIFLETDKINESDKEFIRDAIYRQELLNILGIEDYDENKIDKAIVNLYEKIKHCKEVKDCIKKLAGDFGSLDDVFGLMLLFSYDYMHITHICISEFLETGKINEKNIFNLEKLIFVN